MMSQQEVIRAQVMELLTADKIDQKEAGKRLDVSVRQIKRIVRNRPYQSVIANTLNFRSVPIFVGHFSQVCYPIAASHKSESTAT